MTLDMVQFLFMNLIPFNNYLHPVINKTTKSEFIKWRKAHNFTLKDIFEKMGPLLFNHDNLFGNQSVSTLYTTEYGRCLRIDLNINSTRAGKRKIQNLCLYKFIMSFQVQKEAVFLF